MVDRIRKIFSKTEDENGHPVGYAESAASKINKSDLPGPIQKIDSWLRKHVPRKSEEDCVYCKLIACSVLGGAIFYIHKQAPKTAKTYPIGPARKAYSILTASLAFSLITIGVAHMFDIDIPGISNIEDKVRVKKTENTESKKVETGNIVDRNSDKDGDR